MNSDQWDALTDEPAPIRCVTKGCENIVTFPDFELYCTNCLVAFEQERERLKKQSELQDVMVRR